MAFFWLFFWADCSARVPAAESVTKVLHLLESRFNAVLLHVSNLICCFWGFFVFGVSPCSECNVLNGKVHQEEEKA